MSDYYKHKHITNICLCLLNTHVIFFLFFSNIPTSFHSHLVKACLICNLNCLIHNRHAVLLVSKVFSYSKMDLKSSEMLPFPNPPHPPFWYSFPSSSLSMHPTLWIISRNMVGLHSLHKRSQSTPTILNKSTKHTTRYQFDNLGSVWKRRRGEEGFWKGKKKDKNKIRILTTISILSKTKKNYYFKLISHLSQTTWI